MANLSSATDEPRVTRRIGGDPDPNGRCVLYWMRRAQRAIDNPALETAITLANELDRPLLVFFALRPALPYCNLRHLTFMLEGLAETADRLARRSIAFVIRHCEGKAADEVGRLCSEVNPAAVITEENPLCGSNGWRRLVRADFRPPLWSVDADVIVPSALIAKEQFAARTIRPRIHAQLDRFLRPVRNAAVKIAWHGKQPDSIECSTKALDRFSINRSIQPVTGWSGGTSHGLQRLGEFVRDGLRGYSTNRNHPEIDGTSRLSPYLHYGQLGPHTVALAVRDADVPEADRKAFLEELIVRRELAVNFVRFNPNYRSLASSEPWALRTLLEHHEDVRPNIYSEQQLERAETHDELWNAAQRQMLISGWMHNYMRMYWAKKILEWSRAPADAYRTAVHLNDRYELDGRDANGYAGIAWAIGGKHDRAWGPERPIYGKVRYMSATSTSRKFNSRAYIERWRG